MTRPASRAWAMGAGLAAGALTVALAVPAQAAEPSTTEIQILATNDFHGRILPDSYSGNAGAATMAGAITELSAMYPNTVFAAAGDLIGASTFESFVAYDRPTIEALNMMGLDVSAVGNHEFDQGYDDLINRVMAPYHEDGNPYGGAEWEYLGANVRFVETGLPALEETWIETFGDIEVGFVGVVTDETPSLVSPDGIAGLEFIDEAEAANEGAAILKGEGADIVVMLVHEGAPTTDYADAVDPSNDFGAMITSLSDDIDAVVSGHTHLAYDHKVPVAGWSGRAVEERPVVSAGQYGMYLNQLVFTVDETTGEVLDVATDIIDLDATELDESCTITAEEDCIVPVFEADAAVQAVVDAAVANADVLGSEVLGTMDAPLYRARNANAEGVPNSYGGTRGAESTLGNAVATVQLWATEGNGAEIAFMNPGGLRADMVGAEGDGTGDITYKGAATVQPFANTLVTMTLTGEQIAAVLEEQWQPAGSSRPFLRLGTSDGFGYTYDPDAPAGSRIIEMWLDYMFIEPTDELTVTVNSFLAAGGDNFGTFAEGTDVADSGRIDLNAMVDYLDENGSLGTDYAQHAIGVDGPLEGVAGTTVTADISSLMMTAATDLTDDNLVVTYYGTEGDPTEEEVGTFPVSNVLPTDIWDEHGTATLELPIPAGATGEALFVIEGDVTGTEFPIKVTITDFADVSPNPTSAKYSEHAGAISWLAEQGISTGWKDGTFRPFGNATRDAVAAFLYRLEGEPEFTAPEEPTFPDVTPETSEFYKEIEWLVSEGVTEGWSDGTFRPFAPITRDAFSAFLYRLAGEPEFTAPEEPTFSDVTPETSAFYTEIEWMAAVGITTGWEDGTYRPTEPITRDAIATFLYRFAMPV